MLCDIPTEQFLHAIDECVAELLADAHVTAPPVDARVVARSLNLVVARDVRANTRGRFVRQASLCGARRGTILLADEDRVERWQWALAHEIGEFTAQRVCSMLQVGPLQLQESARERIANGLASALLLPCVWFREIGQTCDWDLLAMKSSFGTASHELIARRMLSMQSPVIISLFDHGKLVWRKSNVLRWPPSLADEERQIWQAARARGCATRLDSKQLPAELRSVRCWPVYEPDWKREFLRTELDVW